MCFKILFVFINISRENSLLNDAKQFKTNDVDECSCGYGTEVAIKVTVNFSK